MVFTASLLGAQHVGEVVENKPASSLVSLGKALNGTPSSLCGRQVAQCSLGKEGWWQEGHPTVKQMPCCRNADYLLWRPLIGKSRKKKKSNLIKKTLEIAKPRAFLLIFRRNNIVSYSSFACWIMYFFDTFAVFLTVINTSLFFREEYLMF